MINVLMSRGIIDSPQLYEHLKNIIDEKHRVCVLAFSFFDFHINNENEWDSWYLPGNFYYEKLVSSFSKYNIKPENITFLNYYKDSKEDLTKKINKSDILYIPGGAPDQMYNRIVEKGILEILKKYSKIIIGSSAGAIIQNDIYHISKDREYNKYSLNKGLGYISDFGIEVHFKPRRQQKKGLRKTARNNKRAIYVIPDDSAIIFNHISNEITLINSARKYYENGKIVK